mmetsp:Transcript_39522/g.58067  ORF Transcript_39522/g.58067 Transcript_39522/m.58067 type:complete len:86 (+) Transcript_39522:51-308(+)
MRVGVGRYFRTHTQVHTILSGVFSSDRNLATGWSMERKHYHGNGGIVGRKFRLFSSCSATMAAARAASSMTSWRRCSFPAAVNIG